MLFYDVSGLCSSASFEAFALLKCDDVSNAFPDRLYVLQGISAGHGILKVVWHCRSRNASARLIGLIVAHCDSPTLAFLFCFIDIVQNQFDS